MTLPDIILHFHDLYTIMTSHEPGEKHDHPEVSKTCKVCSSTYTNESSSSHFGICNRCGYKILIILFIVLIVASYTVWFGIF
jgi:DNA-directed RNA polymerase subunit RPC12/RpoP